MNIKIPSLLLAYTHGIKNLDIPGNTVEEVLDNLDLQFPGIKFRFINEQDQIRTHMKLFINSHQIKDIFKLVEDGDELFVVQALSGG